MTISYTVNVSVVFLNQNKELFKDIFSVPTFILGLPEVYDTCCDISNLFVATVIGIEDSILKPNVRVDWKDTLLKIITIVSRLSIILSTLSSRPGQRIIGWVATKIVGEEYLVRVFGPNVNFVTNPYHPKHIVSIAAFILGLPATLKCTYDSLKWLKNRICLHPMLSSGRSLQNRFLTDAKIQAITLWNTLTSRPALHMGNYLFG